jgi:hypothetical protein
LLELSTLRISLCFPLGSLAYEHIETTIYFSNN